MNKKINKCKCSASGYMLSPKWFNNLQGFQIICVAKKCNIQSKQYKYKGNAIRFWNKLCP